MTWSDVLEALRKTNPNVTPSKVRWLLITGQVTRPPLDRSLRFNFDKHHLQEIEAAFRERARNSGSEHEPAAVSEG